MIRKRHFSKPYQVPAREMILDPTDLVYSMDIYRGDRGVSITMTSPNGRGVSRPQLAELLESLAREIRSGRYGGEA